MPPSSNRKQVKAAAIDAAIARIADEDLDFLTPETLVTYTGCTLEQAKERLDLGSTHMAAAVVREEIPTRSRPASAVCGAEHRHGVSTTLSPSAVTCPSCRKLGDA